MTTLEGQRSEFRDVLDAAVVYITMKQLGRDLVRISGKPVLPSSASDSGSSKPRERNPTFVLREVAKLEKIVGGLVAGQLFLLLAPPEVKLWHAGHFLLEDQCHTARCSQESVQQIVDHFRVALTPERAGKIRRLSEALLHQYQACQADASRGH